MNKERYNSTTYLLAVEIKREAAKLLSKNPNGVTAKQFCKWLKIPERSGLDVIRFLEQLGIGKWIRRPDRASGLYVPNDWKEPAWELTKNQKNVLNEIVFHANSKKISTVSFLDITKKSNTKKGSIVSIIDALERKGYITMLLAGCTGQKSKFKVYPEGNGPQGYRSYKVSQANTIAKKNKARKNDELACKNKAR